MEFNKRFFLAFILILVGIASRFIFVIDGNSVLPNFSAVGAIALFGATYFKGAMRWIVPFLLLLISDIVLNNVFYSQYYDGFKVLGDTWVYAAFIITGIIGYFIMSKPSWLRLGGSALVASIIFFVITNFGVWMTSGLYPKDMNGLIECYTLAIPFFINTLLGNLMYGFLLFGLYEWTAARSDISNVIGTVFLAK